MRMLRKQLFLTDHSDVVVELIVLDLSLARHLY
jgi:hypothetical protein